MLRFIIFVLLLYLILRLVSFWRKISRSSSPPSSASPPTLSGRMVKDEVCQMYLPRENALREIIDGEEHFFCSAECRRKCLEDRKAKS